MPNYLQGGLAAANKDSQPAAPSSQRKDLQTINSSLIIDEELLLLLPQCLRAYSSRSHRLMLQQC